MLFDTGGNKDIYVIVLFNYNVSQHHRHRHRRRRRTKDKTKMEALMKIFFKSLLLNDDQKYKEDNVIWQQCAFSLH